MTLRFDTRGHLTPYTLQNMQMETIEAFFVKPFDSTTRQKLFANLETYVNTLKDVITSDFELWINGSFATQKTNPRDIDMLLIISENTYQLYQAQIDQFVGDSIQKNQNLDVYLLLELPATHQQYPLFEADKAYWLHQFGYARPNRQYKQHPKGIIQLCFSF